MDWFLGIFVFFFVIVVTAVVFCIWLAVTMIRLTVRAVGALFAPVGGSSTSSRSQAVSVQPTNTVRCPTQGCGALNPASARFCRRCGHGLPAAQHVQVRRAAVW